ncbi:MAG: hypothetical protein JO348_01380 [Alphaproteobacteria bacterium]|nr:hypothetical protein [Alphaproteobacteria bacterium]
MKYFIIGAALCAMATTAAYADPYDHTRGDRHDNAATQGDDRGPRENADRDNRENRDNRDNRDDRGGWHHHHRHQVCSWYHHRQHCRWGW